VLLADICTRDQSRSGFFGNIFTTSGSRGQKVRRRYKIDLNST
jgi:hypothetical protein